MLIVVDLDATHRNRCDLANVDHSAVSRSVIELLACEFPPELEHGLTRAEGDHVCRRGGLGAAFDRLGGHRAAEPKRMNEFANVLSQPTISDRELDHA